MRVPENIPDLQRQLLQQLGGNHFVGVTGDGKLRGQGKLDAPDDGQMQLPAIPPAVIPGLTPRGFGVDRGLRDFSGQSMFFVPAAAVGPQGGTVDMGNCPCSVSKGRICCTTGSACSRKLSRAEAV
jgi:hypothetical protein